MPAPDTLVTQTPGQPTVTTQASAQPAEPEYTAKHNGGGRWKIWSTTADDWFSDFLAAGEGAKEAASAEAESLNAGGEPFYKPKPDPVDAVAAPAATTTQASAQQVQARTQAVLTDEGWLVPALPVAYTRE